MHKLWQCIKLVAESACGCQSLRQCAVQDILIVKPLICAKKEAYLLGIVQSQRAIASIQQRRLGPLQ